MEKQVIVNLKAVQRVSFIFGQDNIPIELLINPTSETSGQVYINIDNDHVSTYYWSHAGKPILDFLAGTSPDYLISKFFPFLEPTISDPDYKNFLSHIKKEYGDEIRELYQNDKDGKFKNLLRNAYSAVLHQESLTEDFLYNDSETFQFFEMLGVDWGDIRLLPKLDNPKYMQMFEYFDFIKKILKANLSTIENHQEQLCQNSALSA